MAWKGIIKDLREYDTPYRFIKPAILGQWMLETGRGTSLAWLNFFNPAGMKWRPEMEGFAEKVWYKTDSETYRNGPNGWEKGDWFCKFASTKAAVAGYFRFLSRAPYRGWENHTLTATDFLAFICPSWCPSGYTEKWIEKHGGLNYHQYVVAELFDDAVILLNEAGGSMGREIVIPWTNGGDNSKKPTVTKLDNGRFLIVADGDTDADGSPRVGSIDPSSGQSCTSLGKANGWKGENDYVDSEKIPFYVLPLNWAEVTGVKCKLGDIAKLSFKGKSHYAIFADEGPRSIIGEASIFSIVALGGNPWNSTKTKIVSGIPFGVTYEVIPNSSNLSKTVDYESIQAYGKFLFEGVSGPVSPEPVNNGVTWFEFNRLDAGNAVVSAMTGDGRALTNLVGEPQIQTKELIDLLDKFPGATTFLVAQTDKKVIPEAPRWPEVSGGSVETPETPNTHRPLEGLKVLLDPGHSERATGARGKAPDYPREYQMNLLQAMILVKRLRDAGATVIIVDPSPDDLEQVALRAQGMDLYIAIHHNAANANGIDEGTETHIHPLASSECENLARKVNDYIVAALGTKNRGVKRTSYTVLSVSTRQTNCPRNMLTESYFIDDWGSLEKTTERSTKAANATADAVIDHFKGTWTNEPNLPEPSQEFETWSGVREFPRGANIQLSKNFHLSEFECRCGCSPTKVNGDHLKKLQAYRDLLGKPFRINSAYRCPTYNAKIGGAADSRHMHGDATDQTVDGTAPATVADKAEPFFDGIGRYASFTHLDSRGYKARWNG